MRTQQRQLRQRYDWKAYFYAFCEIHGDPIKVERGPLKGRLLFPDGWGYSSTDYRGPEYPPNEDPARLLEDQILYWTEFRAMVQGYVDHLEQSLEIHFENQELYSAPLHVVVDRHDDSGARVRESMPFDSESMQAELEQAREKLAEIDGELSHLKQIANWSPGDAEE